MPQAQQWSNKLPWKSELLIDAKSYRVEPDLCRDLVPVTNGNCAAFKPNQYIQSRDGLWRIVRRKVEAGRRITTLYGAKKGKVEFNGDVTFPVLWEYDANHDWKLWMSLTPMEVFTLRGGVRLAKGNVIVAGLGLGHQLLAVAQRPQVKQITLVEWNQSLVNFILPLIKDRIQKPMVVVCGNAHEVMPGMKADVALIDIFPDYGGNSWELERLKDVAPDIKKWWGWGTADIYDNSYAMPSFMLSACSKRRLK